MLLISQSNIGEGLLSVQDGIFPELVTLYITRTLLQILLQCFPHAYYFIDQRGNPGVVVGSVQSDSGESALNFSKSIFLIDQDWNALAWTWQALARMSLFDLQGIPRRAGSFEAASHAALFSPGRLYWIRGRGSARVHPGEFRQETALLLYLK